MNNRDALKAHMNVGICPGIAPGEINESETGEILEANERTKDADEARSKHPDSIGDD